MTKHTLIVTCEHGGCGIPIRYAELFRGQSKRVRSHWGWDAGALLVARTVARVLGAPLVASRTTRLLVDLNRSPGHPGLFSDVTRHLDDGERALLLARHYTPHRSRVERLVGEARRTGCATHLAVHSFTPVLRGVERTADIGLLYDPRRRAERVFAAACVQRLRHQAPHLRTRRNYPFRGVADGLTTYLRTRFHAGEYVGLELEVNQRLVCTARDARRVAELLVEAILPGHAGNRKRRRAPL